MLYDEKVNSLLIQKMQYEYGGVKEFTISIIKL